MGNANNPTPVQDYVNTLMLLEGIRCYSCRDKVGLIWIENALSRISTRLEELDKRDSKK